MVGALSRHDVRGVNRTVLRVPTKGVASMRLPTLIAVVLVALGALAGGCDFGGRGDKAGGSHAPLELRLAVASAADEADAPVARFFASRVAALSGGSLRVRVVF